MITAIMLEKAGMHRYVILERTSSLKPLGAALLLSAVSLRCFEQLGLLPEIIEISKPQIGGAWLDESLNYLGNFDGCFIGKRYGYFNVVMTRPDLLAILTRHVPAHKILFSKKVLSLTQTSEFATVRCSDNTAFQADIVIGADGAYSGIRQNMYKAIQAEYQEINVASLENKRLNNVIKPLPKSDVAPLRFDQHAIVGVTGTLDPERYPFLREKGCQAITIFKNSISIWLFPLTHNRIAWCVGSREFDSLEQDRERAARSTAASFTSKSAQSDISGHQSGATSSVYAASTTTTSPRSPTATASPPPTTSTSTTKKKKKLGSIFKGKESPAENFKISEWAPDAVDGMLSIKAIRDQKSPYGGTIGELFDKTPKGNAVKIMLEDKFFKTWYHKRTVLVGDACHKIIPFVGVGSIHAVLDCITLMNALYDMPDGDQFTANDITKAFQTYHALRHKSAAAAVKGSRQTSDVISRTGVINEMIRKGTVRGMPAYLISVAADRIFASRPILTFLPYVPDYGTRKSDPQPLGRRDREELDRLREQQRIVRERDAEARRAQAKAKAAQHQGATGILRNGANRILQSAHSNSNTLLGLSRSNQRMANTPTVGMARSSFLSPACQDLLSLDLPKHNNIIPRPQFQSQGCMSAPASARSSLMSFETNISNLSNLSNTSSVYSYYSSVAEDFKFMKQVSRTVCSCEKQRQRRSPYGASMFSDTGSVMSSLYSNSSEMVDDDDSSFVTDYRSRYVSRMSLSSDSQSCMTESSNEMSVTSCCLSCHNQCNSDDASSCYTRDTGDSSSIGSSCWSHSGARSVLQNDLHPQDYHGQSRLFPYSPDDLLNSYYIHQRAVYPHVDNRKHKIKKTETRDGDGASDQDRATIDDGCLSASQRPSHESGRSYYRDSTASLVSSLWRRYGGDNTRNSTTVPVPGQYKNRAAMPCQDDNMSIISQVSTTPPPSKMEVSSLGGAHPVMSGDRSEGRSLSHKTPMRSLLHLHMLPGSGSASVPTTITAIANKKGDAIKAVEQLQDKASVVPANAIEVILQRYEKQQKDQASKVEQCRLEEEMQQSLDSCGEQQLQQQQQQQQQQEQQWGYLDNTDNDTYPEKIDFVIERGEQLSSTVLILIEESCIS
ncbi:hypothetical protein BGZ94_003729 [Podila epigama]|nr:hypothetical protein BGZ94_003729 [Podila epigama]